MVPVDRFSIVAWPQYHPKYGPIEYKICELTNILHDRKQRDWNMWMLEDGIYQAAMSIKTFDSTFVIIRLVMKYYINYLNSIRSIMLI